MIDGADAVKSRGECAMNPPGRVETFGQRALQNLAMVVFALAVAPNSAHALDVLSPQARQIVDEAQASCPPDETIGTHYILDLGDAKSAEVVVIDCTWSCGSGGCSSFIIVDKQVFEIFGSEPFQLMGTLPGYEDVTAIGWFAGSHGCNGHANSENCLFTMYWDRHSGKLMYVDGDGPTLP